MDKNRDVQSTLGDLLEICRDGEKGFRLAAERTTDADLRALFQRYSSQRARFAEELEDELDEYGGPRGDAGRNALGALHRGLMNLKASVSGDDERAIISECERGEDAALNEYRKALKADLPPALRDIVERHYRDVKEAHDRMRRMELSGRNAEDTGTETDGAPD